MGMVVRSNIMAINANRQLGTNNNQVSKSLEKLSSGFKINRAGDDAAGLAISEKMKAQIKGLEQASANSQDGISLVQTAEGALTEVHTMLNRMVELATKSANGTIQDKVDREAIQSEVDALLTEVDRIGNSTNFNGINLLDGSLRGGAGASGSGLTSGVVFSFKSATTGVQAGKDTTGVTMQAETIVVDGVEVKVDWSSLSPEDQAALKADWTTGQTSTTAKKAAEIMQKAINDAIDSTNSATGSKVKHVTVKGTEAGGAASFEIVSGLEGSKASSIRIGVDNVAGNNNSLLNGLLTAGAPGTPGTGPVAPTAPAVATIGGVQVTFGTVTMANTGTNLTAAQVAQNTKLVTALQAGFTVTADADAAANGAAITLKTPGGLTLEGGTLASGATTANLTIKDGATTIGTLTVTLGAAAGTMTNSATDDVAYTGGNAGTAAVAGGAGTPIDVSAVEKFSGDVGDINGVNFDMVLDGETINMSVAGLENDGATGNPDGTTNATAIKTAIDAALDNYGASKGMAAADITALKDSITVKFNDKGQFEITNNSGKSLGFQDKDGGKAAQLLGLSGEGKAIANGGLTLQVGDTGDDFNMVTVQVDDMRSASLGIAGLDVSTADAARASIDTIKSAINMVSTNRANMGALQNRLEYTINNLDVAAENMTAANSRIRDTDMAKQMMEYTKTNVLTQAAQAMLAQANQQPQSILQLLQ